MRIIAIVLIACQLSACTSWRVETLSPADVINQRAPDAVRVQRADGRREVWYQPQIHGDTLVGFWNTYGKTPDRAAALADLRGISTSHVSAGKTSALVLFMAALIGIGVAAASWDGPLGGCCSQ